MRFVTKPRDFSRLCRRFEGRTSPEWPRCSPLGSHGLPTIGGATTESSMKVDSANVRGELRRHVHGLASSGGFANSRRLA
jgi:hypothetical protein